MDDDERSTPDSLSGKLRDLFDVDDEDAEGAGTLEHDAGRGAPDVEDQGAQPPKRPTDPPF